MLRGLELLQFLGNRLDRGIIRQSIIFIYCPIEGLVVLINACAMPMDALLMITRPH